MAFDLGDLGEFFDASMTFSIKEKGYRIPPVPGLLGLWGKRIAALRMAVPDGATPAEVAAAQARAEKEAGPPPIPEGQSFEEGFLSVALVAELMTDGVSQEEITHLAVVAYGRVIGGDDLALHIFRGDNPKAVPANREERRAAAKPSGKKAPAKKAAPKKAVSGSRTTSTAKATTTRKPASGTGTTSPTKTAVAKKAASRGGKS